MSLFYFHCSSVNRTLENFLEQELFELLRIQIISRWVMEVELLNCFTNTILDKL